MLTFAYTHNILVIADSVYQHNVYKPDEFPFVSCRSVLKDENASGRLLGLELISLNSVSKSMYGECSRRGGYIQHENIDAEVIKKTLDIISFGCTNTDGMIVVDAMVNPPKEGSESYPLWKKEYSDIFNALKRKAEMVAAEISNWNGISFCTPTGAMFIFPRLHLSEKAIEAAKAVGKRPDQYYCDSLIEKTGIITLPGYMFG